MDERLSRAYGRRIRRLTREDLPQLAYAITIVIRKQGHAEVYDHGALKCVRLHGNGVDVSVLQEDWDKIVPYLLDGTLDPTLTPVPRKVGTDALSVVDLPWIDLRDAHFKDKVLALLTTLFPVSYPKPLI